MLFARPRDLFEIADCWPEGYYAALRIVELGEAGHEREGSGSVQNRVVSLSFSLILSAEFGTRLYVVRAKIGCYGHCVVEAVRGR